MSSDLHQVKGWHSRGYLPHFDGGAVPQSLTIRLADSLPAARIDQWRQELRSLPDGQRDAAYRVRLEAYLDLGHGECWLRPPELASLVEDALLHFDGRRYALHAWVVMPNHVHALATPSDGSSLSAIMHSWKSFTSQKANAILRRRGRFWQEEYYDRFIRDETHFAAALAYLENNPVSAGLCKMPADWPWSSARYRASPGSAGILARKPPASRTQQASDPIQLPSECKAGRDARAPRGHR